MTATKAKEVLDEKQVVAEVHDKPERKYLKFNIFNVK